MFWGLCIKSLPSKSTSSYLVEMEPNSYFTFCSANPCGVRVAARQFSFRSLAKAVHGGVLGWVESVGEGRAVAEADGVATGEGHRVSGVEVFGGQRGEEEAGVGGWPWKVV
ncbi:hypothetical protein Acr_11g0007600 [Actinidia rufa]|uniref:Uncharacterized protein n=1 Tax=Actinidia rufa TaxID=165716 RepID=A0A7J0FCN0_9ERIC|nr:hypothetical protein Acr_11g0007600 [Actinidia rufa]